MTDDQGPETTSPDPSLSHCVPPGREDKDSETFFSSSARATQWAAHHFPQAEKVSLFGLVSGKALMVGKGGRGHP